MLSPSLLVTIDTEEDEWGGYDSPRHEVTNIDRIVGLQDLFDRYGVRPTYLITTPVAESRSAIEVLAPIEQRGGCEIGAHCHPWNTPPLVEERTAHNSMICHLPSDLQFEKLANLRQAIQRNYGVEAMSFRAGRWGFDGTVATNLAALGFQVDSSISPFISWRQFGGPDFDRAYPERYRLDFSDLTQVDPDSALTEVPVTTGFNGLLRGLGYPLHQAMTTRPFRALKVRGVADRLGLFAKTWLCPEMTEVKEMVELSEHLLASGRTVLNLMFHSGNLKAGITPFVRTVADEKMFLQRVEGYLKYCQARGIGSATLAEMGDLPEPATG